MEIYVDDIVIKSPHMLDYVGNLKETPQAQPRQMHLWIVVGKVLGTHHLWRTTMGQPPEGQHPH